EGSQSAKSLKILALPRGTRTPVFAVRGRGSGHLEVFRRSEPLRRGADRGFVLSHWPSSPDRTCDASAGVVERGHAVAIGARRAGDAACAIVKGRYPVSVGAGASGDTAVGVVKDARCLLRIGGRGERECQEHPRAGGDGGVPLHF